MTDRVPIRVGMPVYRGWEFLDETLRSIRDQTFGDFRVLMSVDAGDKRSAEVCAKYTDDARFQVVMQTERLGWAGNLNWLMARADGEFFCYWQQDDFCTNAYFQVLYDYALAHPTVAGVYTDLQCFGSRMDRIESRSLTGFALQRVLEQIEEGYFVPFRGLIRRSALAAAGPLRVTPYDSSLEDLVWLAKLAREGELHRVPGALYFKREHTSNTHLKWYAWPKERRRGAWIEWGLGMLEAALPLVGPSEYGRLILTILDRLTAPRPGRLLFYNPSTSGATELIGFAADFVAKAIVQCDIRSWTEVFRLTEEAASVANLEERLKQTADSVVFTHQSHFTEAQFGNESSEWLILEVVLREMWFNELSLQLARDGRLAVRFAAGQPGTALLLDGWSTPECWGVWSDGPVSRLRLPMPEDGKRWRLVLKGGGYAGGLTTAGQRVVLARMGQDVVGRWGFTLTEQRWTAELTLPPYEVSAGGVLELQFPDATSPAETGCGGDPRRLGLGLESLVLELER